MSWKLTTLLNETLYLALDFVLYIKFGPRDVLGWPTLVLNNVGSFTLMYGVSDIMYIMLGYVSEGQYYRNDVHSCTHGSPVATPFPSFTVQNVIAVEVPDLISEENAPAFTKNKITDF
jgi:hypothetical protein